MTKIIQVMGAMLVASLLASCGGGGGSAGDPPFGGGGGGGTTVAADLTLGLSAVSVRNTGSDTITATATAVDANRNAISGIAVTISVDENATVVVSGSQTDGQGQVTGEVGIGADKANRIITVTATSGSLVKTATFAVTGVKLNATAVPAQLAPGAEGQVQYRVLDDNSAPMPNVSLIIEGPGGTQSDGTTDINGRFDFDYQAPSTAGPFTITVTAAGIKTSTDLVVTGGTVVTPPAVGVVESASISASPDVVSVNSDSSANQSEIRTLFVAASNAPVKNIRVRFDLDGDANSIGGTISSGTNLVYSDTSGIARTSYRPGERSSPTEGVTIRACWDEVDFAAGTCPNEMAAKLTVVSEPLSVSIGTNDLLEEGDNTLTYIQRYVVQVVDSAGLAKAGVTVTPSIDLPYYFKGTWVSTPEGWFQQTEQPFSGCLNEDIDRDGRSDVYANGTAEDANGSYNLVPGRPALEPRKADVSISIEGSSTTDTSGKVTLRMEYAKSVGSWVAYNIIVSASGVGGTEGRANFDGVLAVLATDVDDPDVAPAFQFSPYGVLPGDPLPFAVPGAGTVLLCTNPN